MVRPGEPPYRPLIRLIVRPDGLRSYYLAFPALDHYGVIPRRIVGLVGIPAMPFLHANFQHLLTNTIPLVVLLILLAGSRAESWQVVLGWANR